jgi:hypothetical protein
MGVTGIGTITYSFPSEGPLCSFCYPKKGLSASRLFLYCLYSLADANRITEQCSATALTLTPQSFLPTYPTTLAPALAVALTNPSFE